MDPYRKVQSGEKLKIHAQAWNRMLDSIATKPGNSAGGLEYHSAPYVWVYAKNTTGQTVDRWGVMAITGVQITPTSSAGGATAQFEAMPVLTGAAISGNESRERCVALEPIENNKIGRVAISGAVQVKAEDVEKLPAAARLWKDSNWAFVRFGNCVRICKTTSAWAKGTTATLNVWEGGSPSSESQSTGVTIAGVVNRSYDVASGVFVIIAISANGSWYLVDAEAKEDGACKKPNIAGHDLTTLQDYSAAKKQALIHDQGCMKWIDIEDCPATPPSPPNQG